MAATNFVRLRSLVSKRARIICQPLFRNRANRPGVMGRNHEPAVRLLSRLICRVTEGALKLFYCIWGGSRVDTAGPWSRPMVSGPVDYSMCELLYSGSHFISGPRLVVKIFDRNIKARLTSWVVQNYSIISGSTTITNFRARLWSPSFDDFRRVSRYWITCVFSKGLMSCFSLLVKSNMYASVYLVVNSIN